MEWQFFRKKPVAVPMRPYVEGESMDYIPVGRADRANGSPKAGDMIAKSMDDDLDQWLVSKASFEAHYELW